MKEKIVLIDGNSMINRAFYGLPDLTTTSGQHTNGILGFLNILFKILDEENAQYLMVAFDVKHPTFRHEMYKEYKGTRKPMPSELCEQVPVLKNVLKSMGICMLERPGYEADDILGTIAKKAEKDGYAVTLVSGDRDLLQIADDEILVRIPKTKKTGTEIEDYHTKDVIEKYGITPLQVIELKGLMGDSSDNIPGVPGVGEKTAVKLLTEYGDVENTLAHAEEIKQQKLRENLIEYKESALLSKRLATIKTDCELDFTYENAKLGNIYTEEAYQILKSLEIKSLLSKFTLSESDKLSKNTVDQLDAFEEIIDENELRSFFIKIIENLKEEKYIGLSFEKDVLVAVHNGKTAGVVRIDGSVNSEKVFDYVNKVMQMGAEVAFFDCKPFVNLIDEACREQLHDVSIAAYLLNPLKETYNETDIARDYLNITLPSYEEVIGKKKIAEIMSEDPDVIKRFFTRKAYVASKAIATLKEELSNTEMYDLYRNIEMPVCFILSEMEKEGIFIDKEELAKYGAKLKKDIDVLEQDIYKAAGEEFNINSPKQLGTVLFEKMRLPYGKKTKTGYSTSADVLEKLRSEDPVVDKILMYRQLTKLKTTYADGLVDYISKDGRIHTKYMQTVTATGRLSSVEPNLQNIPARIEIGRQIRKLFKPREGYVFVDADYSQIELRILAHMSNDQELIKAYKSDKDIHRITASKVFKVPFESVTPAQRSAAKAVNFGIVYGISSFGLGQDLNISKKEAELYIEQYFETYPGIKAFLNNLVMSAKDKGYARTLYGRRRPIPELSASNFMVRSFGERIAMNSPIQGTAADIMKIAMIKVHERLKKEKFSSKMILQIHDELLVEAPIDEAEHVKEILHDEMMAAAELSVTLETEVKTGADWYETK